MAAQPRSAAPVIDEATTTTSPGFGVMNAMETPPPNSSTFEAGAYTRPLFGAT